MHKIAHKAFQLPVLESGLWFHNDIRDNFYYASYLYAAAEDKEIEVAFDREAAKDKAAKMMLEIFKLQDRNPSSPTFGHWPLHLDPIPKEAPKNTLPVELMGSLMVYFYKRYGTGFHDVLRGAFEQGLQYVYQSNFYRKRMEHYHHHEAKYTAAKLLFGQLFDDRELLEDGQQSLQDTLARLSQVGMSEYGCLPWFWHWVQAFTCAWELTEDSVIRTALTRMLDYLWDVRATYYLRGAWVGAHSRAWWHDLPKDQNVLMDYVQFGDFELPEEMPRTEFAGFLFYEAPQSARELALHRTEPVEIKCKVPRPAAEAGEPLHSYVYLTRDYAVGGIWERAEEFDNEQHRFSVTFPLLGDRSVNRAYFFLAAEMNAPEDLRHQSGFTEVLYYQNCAAALFTAPATYRGQVVGCLPKGDWLEAAGSLYGSYGNIFLAVHIEQPFKREEHEDRWTLTTSGAGNAVVMECIDKAVAEGLGITELTSFMAKMEQRKPVFHLSRSKDAGSEWSVEYISLRGNRLELKEPNENFSKALINGIQPDYSRYFYHGIDFL
ncbi:hypothetical protein [Paenibacillus hexagrammi]|uniref:Uncharacterized protein n=1 Tax=Paenibacillus hexagrammi TaxID=2908839 RepID=A0ABY3SMN6_9BACL|nr:hypothetical protein [Paenibacillus sp. YPD9-1]UJF34984.1 hypothetical protein L0M14_07530 [Paenibacillus sp. YPD9-1]